MAKTKAAGGQLKSDEAYFTSAKNRPSASEGLMAEESHR